MSDPAAKPGDPPPVRLGRLQTASDVRRACKRVGDAVLDGRVDPRRANSALYAVSGAAKAIELEIAERLERRLADIGQGGQPPRDASLTLARESLEHLPAIGAKVIEGEVVS